MPVRIDSFDLFGLVQGNRRIPMRSFAIMGDDSPSFFHPVLVRFVLSRPSAEKADGRLVIELVVPDDTIEMLDQVAHFAPEPADAARSSVPVTIQLPDPFGFRVPGAHRFRLSIDGDEIGVQALDVMRASGRVRVDVWSLLQDRKDVKVQPGWKVRASMQLTLWAGDAFAGYRVLYFLLPEAAESGQTPFTIQMWPHSPRLLASADFSAAMNAVHDRLLKRGVRGSRLTDVPGENFSHNAVMSVDGGPIDQTSFELADREESGGW